MRFDAISRGENKDIFDRFCEGSESVENEAKWSDFDTWTDYDSLLEGHGLELMAYSIYHFAACVVLKELLPQLEKWGSIPLRKWISVDDIAYLLGTLETCIDKWIRQYRYLQEKKKQLVEAGQCSADIKLLDIKLDRSKPTEEMKRKKEKNEHETVKHLPGNKYETGSGIAGAAGQRRMAGLKVYIYKNYFENTNFAAENQKALNERLAAMAEKDILEREEEGAKDTASKRSSQTKEHAPPPVLDDICRMDYAALLGTFDNVNGSYSV